MKSYDVVIIGGGIFGVYSALFLAKHKKKVCLIEKESELLKKASIVNQARLHSGYHYPRSIATARIADEHKERFYMEHKEFVDDTYEQYYAIDKYASFTDCAQYERFCRYLGIKLEPIKSHPYFDWTRMAKIYLTEEFSFDPIMIAEFYKRKIQGHKTIVVKMNTGIKETRNTNDRWEITLNNDQGTIEAPIVINATYSGTNTINKLFNVPEIELMHEITELAFVYSPELQETGLTIMDGHFCSIMPYGLSRLHSLSSVTYTPQRVSHNNEPHFDCQEKDESCRYNYLSICNSCENRSPSNAGKMIKQMMLYLSPKVHLHYIFSMVTIKSKLKASYIDDGRPTEINRLNSSPDFFCLFAGKINSIYEIEKVLTDYV